MSKREHNNTELPAPPSEEVILDVDFTTSTIDKTGNCSYYSGGGTLTYDSEQQTKGIRVSFSTRYKSAIGYVMTSVMNKIRLANKIQVSLEFYPTAYPYGGSDTYHSLCFSTNKNGNDKPFTTSQASDQTLGINLCYLQGTTTIEDCEINTLNIVTYELTKLTNDWENANWNLKTTFNERSGTVSNANWDLNAPNLYFCFPYKFWSGPQSYTGYIKSIQIKVIY